MSLADDFSYTRRSLARHPSLVAVAVLTLALGIGANTAIFSVVNAVLLKPLDWPEPHRLVFLNGELRQRGVAHFPYSPPDWKTLTEEIRQLTAIAGITVVPGSIAGREGPGEQVGVAIVTPNFFDVVGVGPYIGRKFSEADAAYNADDVPAGTPFPLARPKIAVISYRLWQQRFGGNPQVLGREIKVNGSPAEIVGVAREGFRFEMPPQTGVSSDVDVWQPLQVDFAKWPRNNVFMELFGRLKPGVSLQQAQHELDAWDVRMKERFDISRSAGWFNHYVDFHDALTARVKPSVLILMAAVIFVLLIACANVANLLLVRASTRSREIAIRAAVGGSRARLLRQMLIEAAVLALGGALLGLAFAGAGIEVLLRLIPANVPRTAAIGFDFNVVGFTLLVAIVATVLAGIVPALRASRPNLVDQLAERSSLARSSGGKLFRDGMVVLEVTLSFVLLVGSGLMLRSFIVLQNIDPGFDPQGVLTFQLNLPDQRYAQADRQIRFYDEFKERLEALPGVRSAGLVGSLPLGGRPRNGRYTTERSAGDPEAFRQASYQFVKGRYLQTMRTPLLSGRLLDRSDELGAQPRAVIDDLMATRAFPGENAVGKRVIVQLPNRDLTSLEIVGVVRHQAAEELQESGRETIYMVSELPGTGIEGVWTVRTAGDPLLVLGPIKSLVAQMDSDVIVTQARLMNEIVSAARAPTLFALSLIGVFGIIALVLATVGLYSVLSYIVRLRQSELGVRIAFGARPAHIYRLVLVRGIALTLLGAALGIAAGLSVTRLMQSLLVGIRPTDPATFATVAFAFLVIALLAAFVPARQATRVDPMVALRSE